MTTSEFVADLPLQPTWDEPDRTLLETEQGEAPVFPIDVFGPFWKNWCQTSSANANAPLDYTAGTLLATVGAMLGNVRWPDVEGHWEHPSVLWIGLVGDPSAAKSPGMRPVARLIDRIEIARRDKFMTTVDQFAADIAAAELRERDWKALVEHAVEQGRTPPERPADARRPDMPVQPNLRVMDATIEAIQMTAAGCPRGLLQFSDELTGWFGSFDRYRGSGVSSDRPFWLKAFDGDPYSISRKGQETRNGFRAPIEIPHLSIGIVGGIQPEPLRTFLRSGDDGLAHRFLWMWPERTTTFRIPRRQTVQGESLDLLAYGALLQIDGLVCEGNRPVRKSLSEPAITRLEAYGQSIVDRQGKVNNRHASTLGKAPGLVLRLSSVLTYMWWSATAGEEPDEIGLEAIEDAIMLMDTYFLPQAERVRQDASVTEAQSDARLLIDFLREKRWSRFTGRDLQRAASGRLGRLDYRKAACQSLVDACLLRGDFHRKGTTPGRQKEAYEVNPILFEASTFAAAPISQAA